MLAAVPTFRDTASQRSLAATAADEPPQRKHGIVSSVGCDAGASAVENPLRAIKHIFLYQSLKIRPLPNLPLLNDQPPRIDRIPKNFRERLQADWLTLCRAEPFLHQRVANLRHRVESSCAK